jgi:hypothetical protein
LPAVIRFVSAIGFGRATSVCLITTPAAAAIAGDCQPAESGDRLITIWPAERTMRRPALSIFGLSPCQP